MKKNQFSRRKKINLGKPSFHAISYILLIVHKIFTKKFTLFWELVVASDWSFNVDEKKGGRLHKIVIENFGFEETNADLKLSYLPIGLISSSECPPVIIGNSQQVQNFLGFCEKHQSTRLCVLALKQSKGIQIRSTLILRCQLMQYW